jgi:hypothetical protein
MIGCKRRLAVGWTIHYIYKRRREIFVVEEINALFGAFAIEIGKGAYGPFRFSAVARASRPTLFLKHLVRLLLGRAVEIAED